MPATEQLVIIVAQYQSEAPGQPTPDEIRAVHLAGCIRRVAVN
jgi:hypothetical protein